MKKINKWISGTLAVLMLAGVVGCGSGKNDDSSSSSSGNQIILGETEYDLVKEGNSSYRILLSETPTETEKYAAKELSLFFKEATGVELPVVNDNTVEADKNGKYLSIGNTELFAKSGQKVAETELGVDGYKVVTYGNCVLMNGAEEGGKLYSVYDFLERQFNFEVFTADEIYIDQTQNAKLKDLKITEVPDFEGRDVHDYAYFYNVEFAVRKRMRGPKTAFTVAHGNGTAWSPTLFTHSVFILTKHGENFSLHRDWFSDNGTDLCYGTGISDTVSGKLMRETMVERLKFYITRDSGAMYFMVGLEDSSSPCGCQKCLDARALYGGEHARLSGLMVKFVNMLAREIKAWLKETAPERADRVKLCMYAYQHSEQPPVTWNEQKGKYEWHKEAVPDDNVVVRLAPFSSVYSKTLLDETANPTIREAILGWNAMGVKMSIWSYSCPFGSYLYPVYNWHTIQDNYRIFADVGVVDILDQGPRDSTLLPFQGLRDYVQAELLWDVDQDINELIERYMTHYYKDAAPYMMEYFNLINSNYALMERTKGYLWYPGTDESTKNAKAEYYPKAYLNSCLEIFERAYQKVATIEDLSERLLVQKRLEKEELSPRYILLEHYKAYYDDAVLRQMFTQYEEDALRLGLTYFKEDNNGNGYVSHRYQNWWNSLQ